MERVQIIELKESIFDDNDADAARLREELRQKKTCLMNLMSSPGSGKTTTLLALNKFLSDKLSWGVCEADIDSDVDAKTLADAGIPSIQLHTGGMCHLDADMMRQGIRAFDRDDLDFIVLENIGNLVCPAEFDTGASFNLTILSVPEGDDKPAKYPLMYEACDAVAVNKTDTLPVFDFSKERFEHNVKSVNPDIDIFYISAKTGEGVEMLADYILKKVAQFNSVGEISDI